MKVSFFGALRQVRSDGKDKNAVVSFTLTDEPQHIDLLKSDSKEEVSIRLTLRTATQVLSWRVEKTRWKMATVFVRVIAFFFFFLNDC